MALITVSLEDRENVGVVVGGGWSRRDGHDDRETAKQG